MTKMKVGTEIGPMKGSRVVLMTSMRVVSHLIDISLLTVLFHMSVDTVVKSTAEQAAMIDGEYLQIIAWRLTIKKVVERKRSPNIEIDKGFQNLEFEIKQEWHWTNMEFLYFVCGMIFFTHYIQQIINYICCYLPLLILYNQPLELQSQAVIEASRFCLHLYPCVYP